MNKTKILGILRACSIVRNLIIGKRQLRILVNVNYVDHEEINKHLKIAEDKTELKIMMLKSKIGKAVSNLNGFNGQIHKTIDYFSLSDLEDGMVDISINSDDKYYLNLSTGEILSAEEVPEDKRSR